MTKEHEEQERKVMSLVWENLYGAQDEDRLRRGDKFFHNFQVWVDGVAYLVSVKIDEQELKLQKQEEE